MSASPPKPQGSLFQNGERWRAPLLVALAILMAAGVSGETRNESAASPSVVPRQKLIYVGDAYFPPFEYKDASGKA